MSPNRLINEKSPYLKQHAYNPVDWYPWCDEAFKKAQIEDKPVFLSIGYSTCHWCHVMEKESFENQEIAEILNKFFVSIKVDREERPDIDNIYMKFCYIFNNHGGWPLTVFMNYQKKPFYVDTYIPKDDAFGKMGLKNLLLRIVQIWQSNREKINEVADGIISTFKSIKSKSKGIYDLSEEILERGYEELKSQFDREFGGFGISPKFPLPINLMYIHRYYYRSKENEALKMNLHIMKKMRFGGIYDQIGFGFHRYSTDRMWILPHFEKMLYDNALLMIAYTEAYQITKDVFYKDVVNEIADFLLRDMYYEKGAFYSAIDADSEGEEGKFYIWGYEEIKEELTEDEFLIAEKLFSLSKEGNFYDEVQRKKTGKNILYIQKDLEEFAEEFKINLDFLKTQLRNIREKLFKIRQKRVKPFRDEKILTDWNSLTCIAFAKAGIAFKRGDYLHISEKCMGFILNNMFDKDSRLLHLYKDGESLVYAYLEDHAYLIWALIELYLATFKSFYLSKAIEITNNTIQHFWDYENNGFYHTPQYSELILTKVKESYDGVLPSGNAVMSHNLIRLARITGNIEYEDIAKQTLKTFSDEISKMPSNHAFSLIALDLILNGTFELIVIPENQPETFNFLMELKQNFIPNLLILVRDSETEKIFPNIKNMNPINEKTTYYLCKNFECQPPTNDEQTVKRAIIS
jgi:uncharacterized protein YyaL (SSP411 family)